MDIEQIVRWIIIGTLVLIGASLLGVLINIGTALLSFVLKVLVVILIVALVVRFINGAPARNV